MTIAFVLVSWRPNVPAGMERAVIAHAAGLQQIQARSVIVTADPAAPSTYHNVPIERLHSLDVQFPCDDTTLRAAIDASAAPICAELTRLFRRHQVRAVVYVDALWGLGRIMPTHPGIRNILAAHVVGHDADLQPALARNPDAIIAPSATVLSEAAARGYDSTSWSVVPNTLLTVPEPQSRSDRHRLWATGPVRVLARLGPEKGVAELLDPIPVLDRHIEVAVANAPFELAAGSQEQVRRRCQALAATTPGVTVLPGLAWHEVSAWLAGASVVIMPSRAETFGLVALEALAASTPVVAYDVGNLPHLIGDGGIIAPYRSGPDGLWRAARHLLTDPVGYAAASRAAYYRSRDYWPALVANQLLKVVS
ncbi:glycosyltransferase family 4 protein [Micromonospora aurantiaca (nom. illeg.)]|uniref:glycosyltransferase family 4 protein n=1 Tax=Micromonospora aurantiaca (nom. illeg.) TaxID=47850 RepID=UPI003DA54328